MTYDQICQTCRKLNFWRTPISQTEKNISQKVSKIMILQNLSYVKNWYNVKE